MKTLGVFLGFVALAFAESNPAVFQIRPVSGTASAAADQMIYTSKDGQPISLYVNREAALDATSVSSAEVVKDVAGSPYNIKITFTPQGRERFAEFTRQHLQQRIAVIVDGKVYAAPVIQSELSVSSITVAGDLASEQQAAEAAAKIQKAAGNR